MLLTLALLAQALPAAPVAPAPDAPWPSFRGADGSGVVEAHPTTWSEDENLAWKVEVPGGGWSSPVVAGERVFVTTAIQPEKEGGGRPLGFAGGVRMPETRGAGAKKPTEEITFQVRAYALGDGALLWTRDLATRVPAHGIHPSNTFATESPATDGARLVVYFGMIGLVAGLDLDGKVLWTQEVGSHATTADFGTGSSVAIADGNAIVQCDNEEESFVAAFRVADGEPSWRAERRKGTAWASPVLWRRGELVDVVLSGPDALTGYAPADGAVRWRLAGIGGTFSASPAVAGERLVFGNSAQMRRGPLAALDASVAGEVDMKAEGDGPVTWTVQRAGPGFASPVVAGGVVFVVNGQGILTGRDAATGEELFDERLPEAYSVVASPWTDGEYVYVLAEGGNTFVVRAAREYELVRTNVLEGTFWGTASAANGALLVRSADSLYCVRAAD